jgi:RNA polymerase sigma-70 factor (ECF subfamily)
MPPTSDARGEPSGFISTTWSIIVQAAGNGPEARLALNTLCQAYWYPLYAYLRRQGAGSHDAEDAVQSFLAWLVESGVVGRADPQRGRFRSFLLATFKQFLSRQRQRAAAARRRPARPLLSIDAAAGAERYRLEPFHELTPEKQYDYAWALAVLDRALTRLGEAWERDGKGERFRILKGCLTGEPPDGRQLAGQLGMSEGAVRVAIHRLKQGYGQLLREEIGRTVAIDDDIDSELDELLSALNPG